MSNIKNPELPKIKSLEVFDLSWEYAKYYSSIIDTPEARKALIHVLENWRIINESSKGIWLDLVERAGFYPYFMDKIKTDKDYTPSLQSRIRSEYFKSEYLEGVYFHEKQKEIEIAISLENNIAVSAPTSFGKSLLIEEFVAKKKYSNVLIIQPTLALIDETRKNMSKYTDYYNIIINTKQKPKDKNIFILTAERVLEFSNLPEIDFFVVDEFYKVSNHRKDGRIDALNISIMKVMENNPQALFLTPSVDSLSKKFIDRYCVKFFKTDYSLVNTNIIEVRNQNNGVLKYQEKKKRLFKILSQLKEPSIVYVKSPNEAYKLANDYIEYLECPEVVNTELPIFEWMDENISEEWQLKRLMKYGVGAHNGALPRHVVTSEIDMFNNGMLLILFATVSLIEGVNTVAKNILIFSRNKGRARIDFFDYANISGRAGRMGKHYTGNVYLFHEELEQEHFSIDVPFTDQDELSDEILFHIPFCDVIDKKRKEKLESGIPEDLISIISKNLISINGQKRLYLYIQENGHKLDYLRWRKIPTFEELWRTLHLAYKFLEENNNTGFSKKKAIMSLDIVNSSLKETIIKQKLYYDNKNKNKNRSLEKVINDVLKFVRNDASFKIPKLLSVVESIQKYVFQENGISSFGDYKIFSALLENGKIGESFRFLIDFGVPSSAVKKIEMEVKKNLYEKQDILSYIEDNFERFEAILLKYEFLLLKNAIR